MARSKKSNNSEPEVKDTQENKKDKDNAKDKVKNNSEEIEKLKVELEEARDKYLRLFAEFENFKKRNSKERIDLIRTAGQDTIQSILPVLDDFDRAKKSADDESNNESFSEGVTLVYNKLYNILKAKGLEEIPSLGETFDPEIHEAITEIAAPSEELKGKIIDTLEKGYYLNDKIIRYPKVVVGK